MSARHLAQKLLFVGTASAAVLSATPAMAQPEMGYEGRVYEYAQPLPETAAATAPVVYNTQPIVQAMPVRAPMPASAAAPVRAAPPAPAPAYGYQPEYGNAAPVSTYPYPVERAAPAPVARPTMQPPMAYPAANAPSQLDREAWLDECERSVSGKSGKQRGGIIGGLLGAIAGGVTGNRIADGERLAGTLIGAGAGGILGGLIGSVISGSGRNNDRAECEAYLNRYLASYGQGYGYGYPGGYYNQAYYGRPVTYAPVWVAVPQRAVVREYVTEQWVDDDVVVPTPTKRVRVVSRPAAQPTKRVKTFKYHK